MTLLLKSNICLCALLVLSSLLPTVKGDEVRGMCTGSYQEPASNSGNGKTRPKPQTKCVEFAGKVCHHDEGRWGSSWCQVDEHNWGAECVPCSVFDPSSRVVEVIMRYARPGMEEQFQVARKEVTDIVRSYEGCLNYREFEAFEGTFDEVPGGPANLPDLGEKLYMLMLEYSNVTRFWEIAAMPDVQTAFGHVSSTFNIISFFISQPMDPDFDVADFGQSPNTVTVQLLRTVQQKLPTLSRNNLEEELVQKLQTLPRRNLDEGTQFEVLFSYRNITNIDGLQMWVDKEEVRTDGSVCVACMKLVNWDY